MHAQIRHAPIVAISALRHLKMMPDKQTLDSLELFLKLQHLRTWIQKFLCELSYQVL